jgi:hypothetical protein
MARRNHEFMAAKKYKQREELGGSWRYFAAMKTRKQKTN